MATFSSSTVKNGLRHVAKESRWPRMKDDTFGGGGCGRRRRHVETVSCWVVLRMRRPSVVNQAGRSAAATVRRWVVSSPTRSVGAVIKRWRRCRRRCRRWRSVRRTLHASTKQTRRDEKKGEKKQQIRRKFTHKTHT